MSQHVDKNMSVADLVTEQVKKTPDCVAVIYDGMNMEEGSCHCQRITYSEMCHRANKVSQELQRHGAEKEVVGVCVEPGINLPSILLGILRASSSYFPFGVDGFGFVKQSLQRLGITHLLLDGSTLQSLQSLLLDLQVNILPTEELRPLGVYLGKIQLGAWREGRLPGVGGLAYCITTSGTTGTPKVVRVPHACIVPNILDFRKEFRPDVGDVTFLTSPLTFDPSVIDIFMTLSSGAALLVVPASVKMSGDSLFTMLSSRHRVTILQITPSLFRKLDPGRVRATLLGVDCPLRVLAFGGETFPARSVLDPCMHPQNPTTLYNVYGITEVSCWATLHCARSPKGSVLEPVAIGDALTGTRVKVVDAHGGRVKSGLGQIWIGGSERTCLLNEEDEHLLSREDGVWRRSGDLGVIHSDGSTHCLGREDRQIKRHGKRLDLNTLEKVGSQLTWVEECRAEHREGKLLMWCRTAALVRGREEEEDDGRLCGEVRGHVRKVLPAQYHPDEVTVVRDFPVNSHGKLDTASLLRQLKCRLEQGGPPSTVETWSRKLWQDTHGDSSGSVWPTDTFLACGGDSLKAVRLVETVERGLGRAVPNLLDVILTRTFADFLHLIKLKSISNGHAECNKDVNGHAEQNKDVNGHAEQNKDVNSHAEQNTDVNGHAEQNKAVNGRKNGQFQPRKHGLGNPLDLSELPAKVRKEASLCLDQDEKVCSNPEHRSSATDLSITTHHHVKESNPEHGSSATDVSNTTHRRLKENHQETVSAEHLAVATFPEHLAVATFPEHLAVATFPEHLAVATFPEHLAVATFPEQQQHFEEKRTWHAPFDQNSTTGSFSMNANSAEDTFVDSVSRVNKCWTSEDCAVPGSVLSGVGNGGTSHHVHSDNGSSLCSVTGKEVSEDEAAFRLDLLWSCDTGKCVDASPLVGRTRGGRAVVFIGSHSHRFLAVDMMSGSVVWSVDLGDRVESSACLAPCGKRVVVGCYDHSIYVLKTDSGEEDWQVVTGDVVKCSPVAHPASHLVFCGSHDGHLYALHCSRQRVEWKSWLGGGGVFASPVVSDDGTTVFAATLRGHVTAVSTATGTVAWSVALGKPVFSSPAVQGGRLYVGCVDSCLYCLASHTGLQVWVYKTEGPIFSSPAMAAATTQSPTPGVVFGSHDNCLHCVSHAGQLVWKHRTTSTLYASPYLFCAPRKQRTDINISVNHCQRKPEVQGLKSDVNIQRLDERSRENDPVNRLPLKCDIQTDINAQKAESQAFLQKATPQAETGTKKLACQNGLRNGENGETEHSLRNGHSDCMPCCRNTGNRRVEKRGELDTGEASRSDGLSSVHGSGESCVICEPFVACASTDGLLRILSYATGKLIGQEALPGEVFSSPIVVGNLLLVGCRDERVYCYQLNTV